jgi:GNAT superfamily N-acetyltransferase
MQDIPAVTALVRLHEQTTQGAPEVDESDIIADWSRASFDPAVDAVVVFAPDGSLVAEAEAIPGRLSWAHQDPAHLGLGIGSWLEEWLEIRARAQGASMVRQVVFDPHVGGEAFLRSRGYEQAWEGWLLRIHHDERPSSAVAPSGVELRDANVERDREMRIVHRLIQEAFGDLPEHQDEPFDDWAPQIVHRDGFGGWAIQVAVADGEIVGAAALVDYPEVGTVQQLAVARHARRRGIGEALLHRSFEVFWERGQPAVDLATDSRTGALGLYQRAGMQIQRHYRTMIKPLR